MVAFTYPEGPKAKDNDDEVNSVSQKHKHIYVSHGAVVWVDEVVEELSDGHIYLQSPAKQGPPTLCFRRGTSGEMTRFYSHTIPISKRITPLSLSLGIVQVGVAPAGTECIQVHCQGGSTYPFSCDTVL